VSSGAKLIVDGEGKVTLDGQRRTQLLIADEAKLVSIRGLTLRNGFAASQDGCCSRGGAVHVTGGALEVLDSTFEDNTTESLVDEESGGGAIFVVAASRVLISGVEFRRNTSGNGGALSVVRSPLHLYGSSFEGNRAEQTGGAFRVRNVDSTVPTGVTVCATSILNNVAVSQGGGAHISGDGATLVLVQDALFEGNRVNAPLGGSALGGGARIQSAPLRMERTSFIGNISERYGGGLHFNGVSVAQDRRGRILNSTFYDNQAGYGQTEGSGGGLRASNAELSHLTIANNRAPSGAGALLRTDVTMSASLMVNNTATKKTACSEAQLKDNLIWPPDTQDSQGPCITSTSPSAIELGALVRPAQSTPFLPLPRSSPAAMRVVTDCPTLDQKLDRRPVPCAVGAVEP
jgi:hypothetical protein